MLGESGANFYRRSDLKSLAKISAGATLRTKHFPGTATLSPEEAQFVSAALDFREKTVAQVFTIV